MKTLLRLGLVLTTAATVLSAPGWAGELLQGKLRGDSCNTCPIASPQDLSCKVCKPVAATKKVTKTIYESKVEWYCLAKCPCLLHAATHDCTSYTTCDKPRCRRVLVKKIITEEQPITKCQVEAVTMNSISAPR